MRRRIFLIFIAQICFLASFLSQNSDRNKRIETAKILSKIQKQISLNKNYDTELVLSWIDEVLKMDRKNKDAIAMRAKVEFRKGELENALVDLNSFIKDKPKSILLMDRAKIRLQLGDGRAFDDIKESMDFYTDNIRVISDAAELYLSLNRLKESEELYLRTLKVKVDERILEYFRLAEIKMRQKDTLSALEKYRECVNNIEGQYFFAGIAQFPKVYKAKAELEFSTKRYNDAIATISKLIFADSHNPDLYKLRIKYFKTIGEVNKACADEKKLSTLSQAVGQAESGLCDFQKADLHFLEDDSTSLAEAAFLTGSLIPGVDVPSLNKAIEFYTKALLYKKNHVAALAHRAACYMTLKDNKMAVADLNKVLGLNPNLAQAHRFKVLFNLDSLTYEQAIFHLDMACRLAPTDPDVFGNRAFIKALGHDTIGAISDLSIAIEHDHSNPMIYFQRGAFHFYGKQNYALALEDFEKAIELVENDPMTSRSGVDQYYQHCARAFSEMKMYDKAIEQIETAIVLEPGTGEHYYFCGEIKARMNNMKGACREWKTALQLGYDKAEEVLLYNCKD